MTCEPFKPITRQMAVEILGISLTTLDALVASGALPVPKPIGSTRRVYWLPEVFYEYLRQTLSGAPAVALGSSLPTAVLRRSETLMNQRGPKTRPRRETRGTSAHHHSTRLQRLND
jgi:predicted DNA-binding transcriptional regulator AlpA